MTTEADTGIIPPLTRDGAEMVDVEAKILEVEEKKGGVWNAVLLAPEIASRAKPMQFVQIKIKAGIHPFLRRPFSLSSIDSESGAIGVTWAVVGKGTAMMTGWEPGEAVPTLGPLGNGFDPASFSKTALGKAPVWLIAGGTGLAPMYPLAQALRNAGRQVTLFYGARSAPFLMDTAKFAELGCDVRVCTDDGSIGRRGLVTSQVTQAIGSEHNGAVVAVACGPLPMLQSLKAQVADTTAQLYVSLEGRMACGIGLCRGCAVKAAPPREGYFHVCIDGPVFRAQDVLMEEED